MAKDDGWTAEEIASIEIAIKSQPNSHELMVGLDRLFFAAGEVDAVANLKEAGYLLSKIKDSLPADLQEKWVLCFGRQLRGSVDRAKRNAKK